MCFKLIKMIAGFVLLLLLKFLFCVDFLFFKIWFVFIPVHLRWNIQVALFSVKSSFQVQWFSAGAWYLLLNSHLEILAGGG